MSNLCLGSLAVLDASKKPGGGTSIIAERRVESSAVLELLGVDPVTDGQWSDRALDELCARLEAALATRRSEAEARILRAHGKERFEPWMAAMRDAEMAKDACAAAAVAILEQAGIARERKAILAFLGE